MTNHALLSASSSTRWLNCPPSARLCETYEDIGSDYALEGTDAHALCEYRLKKALGREAEDPTENLTFYNTEMSDCADGYVSFVMELLEEARKTCADPLIVIEQRVDYSRFVAEGFGTADCIIIADGTLYVVDYKYGRGVRVEAEGNPQMRLYAIGALEIFDALYDIDRISMTIYQPRLGNISTSEVSKAELYEWAETVVAPTAELAFAGDGEYHCGSWCAFCKAKTDCRERARANMTLARYEFKRPPLLTDAEVEEILGQLDDMVSWANDLKEYALQAAVSGKTWTGYKLVEGRSVRKFTDDKAVAGTLVAAGYDPYEKKLLSMTELQKMLGKNTFDELLGGLIYKPQGKPTLVPATDKRPEMKTAKADFENNDIGGKENV